MSKQLPALHLCIAGSPDFLRRMSIAAEQCVSAGTLQNLQVYRANPAEAKAKVIETRPDMLLMDMGFKITTSDAIWLRQLLTELRERFGKSLYIVVAVTSPEKFVFAGDLLFADQESLVGSELLDNLLFSPPYGFPSIPSLESQFQHLLACVSEVLASSTSGANPLPALGAPAWVPSMADPESWSVWMRWLPRYARYVNENPIIIGPTGSGKTKLAAALHELSGRKGPFVSMTPRDFSSTELIQAELFGAGAGAYTGAVDKWGLVKKADKGTLFIDELQSIDLDLQGKLITFIENKTYRRVGEAESHFADVRFVFASNRPLALLVKEGKLRDDFAYRLERLQLVLRPLCERRLDIAAGACSAMAKVLRERADAGRQTSSGQVSQAGNPEGFTSGAYGKIFGAEWPGNLRQLENSVAKFIELTNLSNKRLIDEECINEGMQGSLGAGELSTTAILEHATRTAERTVQSGSGLSLASFIAEVEEHARTRALEAAGGCTEKAAQLLGESNRIMELFAAARSKQ